MPVVMPDLKDGGDATDLFALDLAAAPSPANVPIQLHALAVACSRVVAGVKGAAVDALVQRTVDETLQRRLPHRAFNWSAMKVVQAHIM